MNWFNNDFVASVTDTFSVEGAFHLHYSGVDRFSASLRKLSKASGSGKLTNSGVAL